MFIYIDESGSFSFPTTEGPAISCVGALIIQEENHDTLLEAFAELSKDWPRDLSGEIKGKLLSEDHFYETTELLASHNALFDCVAIDVGLENRDRIIWHRDEQARKLLAGLTPQHQPSLIAQMKDVSATMSAMSIPQYLQFVAMNELVAAVLSTKVLRFAQTNPKELGKFRWRIDAKDKVQTQPEKVWNLLLPAFLEVRSFQEPQIMLIGADYSYFDRFEIHLTPETVRRRQILHSAKVTDEELANGKAGSDINMIIREDIAFGASHKSLGLQLADVVTSIAARAMRGTIRLRGWWHLGKIMVQPLPPDEVIRFRRFQQGAAKWTPSAPYVGVVSRLAKSSLSLVVDDPTEETD